MKQRGAASQGKSRRDGIRQGGKVGTRHRRGKEEWDEEKREPLRERVVRSIKYYILFSGGLEAACGMTSPDVTS